MYRKPLHWHRNKSETYQYLSLSSIYRLAIESSHSITYASSHASASVRIHNFCNITGVQFSWVTTMTTRTTSTMITITATNDDNLDSITMSYGPATTTAITSRLRVKLTRRRMLNRTIISFNFLRKGRRRRRRPLIAATTSSFDTTLTLSRLVSFHLPMLKLCFWGSDNANAENNDDISRILDFEWNHMNEDKTTASNILQDGTTKSTKIFLAGVILIQFFSRRVLTCFAISHKTGKACTTPTTTRETMMTWIVRIVNDGALKRKSNWTCFVFW
jgi:hypothetical protein